MQSATSTARRVGEGASRPHPVVTLFMSSATIAVALALGNVVWLRTAEGIGRIRDLQV